MSIGFDLIVRNRAGCQHLYAVYVTLLMYLHDFLTEPVNPEDIFRDARTVPFCLITDHISACHINTVLVCSGHVVNGSVVSVRYQRRWYQWNGYLATMGYHAELVEENTLMDYHEELVRVDFLMQYHEKSDDGGFTHGVP